MSAFPFLIHATDGAARTGVLKTARGDIRTPAFMPVGTAGTVKALTVDQVKSAGADIILGNTYHLMLRPGPEPMKARGGLHNFMGWRGPILTDSGGFQVMSLSKIRKLNEQAVTFQSHIDGSRHILTPERSIEIQADAIGSDIVMQLDECVAWPAEEPVAAEAMRLSARWAARCKTAFGTRDAQALFGIQQGSTFEHLRKESSDRLTEIGFDGYALGGLAVGEGHQAMCEVLDYATGFLPADRPRYLMGVGKPIDLVEGVARGVDMFDCVLPTRSGRHGQAWTWDGPLNLTAAAGRRQRLPGQPRLFESLPAPPVQGGGNPRSGAALLAQHRFLPGADGRHARGHRRRAVRSLPARLQGAAAGGLIP
jgi:queuine tRNA-ribosyltransferase